MTIYQFEVVPFRATKTVKCLGCGKILRRAKTFDQTINPYNRNAQGMRKSREEIMAELRAEADTWMKLGDVCGKCFAFPYAGSPDAGTKEKP